MSGDYPSKTELRIIRTWEQKHNLDFRGLLDFIEQVWHIPEWGFKREEHKVELHCGGWSGNEDIIKAMKQNIMLWTLFWAKTERGGHYYFNDEMACNELKGFRSEWK